MAYPAHHLFVVGGTFNGTDNAGEIWQIGVRGQLGGPAGSTTKEDDHLAAVAPVLATWFAGVGNRMRSDCQLKYIKLNAIAPDGSYVTPNSPHTRNVTATGGQSPVLPDFVTLAWSWQTDAPGRLARNGRVYPPSTLGGYNSGQAKVSSTEQSAQAAVAETFLGILYNANNASLPTVFGCDVVSSQGVRAPIKRVRVGNVLDVQRRRKNKLLEQYVTQDFIPVS